MHTHVKIPPKVDASLQQTSRPRLKYVTRRLINSMSANSELLSRWRGGRKRVPLASAGDDGGARAAGGCYIDTCQARLITPHAYSHRVADLQGIFMEMPFTAVL
ncbi:hypothetical protein EVAR_74483_1 [Eumeta japonica]|uniref:Uncharacterized protein n=1 Tax=Eumeta variegata TaxID=151549 RepID=A0A4C1TCH1_EUMVA|nr:hypothetical protein EVAR_74483_1 [Eumeta japonica]